MITQREVKILTDAIQEQSGVVVPPEAALTALYAVANYNYRLIPQKTRAAEARQVHEGAARREPEPKSGATANLSRVRPDGAVKIVTLTRARTQAAVVTRAPSKARFEI
jgi:hypothetical protein